eukprot:m.99911 g.99911  ORF g.99911 m.99911 type:complete len:586 (-) comp27203_c0_seq2:345-2102(-)
MECLGVSKSFCEWEYARLNKIDTNKDMSLIQYVDHLKQIPVYADAKSAIYLHHTEADEMGNCFVGTATVFISHAWGMSAYDFFEVLLRGMADSDYAWIDLYMYTQFGNGDGSTAAWIKRFEGLIGSIGSVLAILTPWRNPVPLTRIWCLFEMVCAMRTNVVLKILLPHEETTSLRSDVLKSYDSVMDMLTTIRFENAQATKVEDLHAISQVVAEMPGGAHQVNVVIKKHMRQWMLENVKACVDNGGEGLEYARLLSQAGLIMMEHGNHILAVEYLHRCIAIETQELGRYHVACATTLVNIGSVYFKMSDLDQALKFYLTGLAVYKKQSQAQISQLSVKISTCLNNIGAVYRGKEDNDTALHYLSQAVVLDENNLLENNTPELRLNVAKVYSIIGATHMGKGDLEQALGYMLKCLPIQEQDLGAEHPTTAATYNSMGLIHSRRGEFAKALEYLHKALAVYEKQLGEQHHTISNTYNNIAGVYRQQNNFDDALVFTRKALALQEAQFGVNHPATLTSLGNIGILYRSKGHIDDALRFLLRAVNVATHDQGGLVDSSGMAHYYVIIEHCYKDKGDKVQAQVWHNKRCE